MSAMEDDEGPFEKADIHVHVEELNEEPINHTEELDSTEERQLGHVRELGDEFSSKKGIKGDKNKKLQKKRKKMVLHHEEIGGEKLQPMGQHENLGCDLQISEKCNKEEKKKRSKGEEKRQFRREHQIRKETKRKSRSCTNVRNKDGDGFPCVGDGLWVRSPSIVSLRSPVAKIARVASFRRAAISSVQKKFETKKVASPCLESEQTPCCTVTFPSPARSTQTHGKTYIPFAQYFFTRQCCFASTYSVFHAISLFGCAVLLVIIMLVLFFDPSYDEWNRAESMCAILEVFYAATNIVSGCSYPTSNLYFQEMWNIRVMLKNEITNVDPIISLMVYEMQSKFDKYWSEAYLTICVPLVLDPRFKLVYIEYRLKQVYGDDAEMYLNSINRTIRVLFEEYSAKFGECDTDLAQGENVGEYVEVSNLYSDWDMHCRMKQHLARNELEDYLNDELFPRRMDFNILNWWDMHSIKYPVLSRVARDLLAIPTSTVASESAFSIGERVISDYRSRLTSDTAEALICLQDWLRPTTEHPDSEHD